MQIGIGLDARLALATSEQHEVVRAAAQLGYTSAWTPSSATGRDSCFTCAGWNAASAAVTPGGLETGILVVPAPTWTAPTLAALAATAGEATGGRFILGIGIGNAHTEPYRRMFGLAKVPPIDLMRDYLSVLRALLAGETVDHAGRAINLHGVQLDFRPPRVPVYLSAMGPRMLRLAGELADGVAPNWSSPEQIAWCRERVAEGARAAGRDPADIPVVQYIRVCVDEDVDAARRAFAAQLLAYALARPGASKEEGYRGHFGRMGFDAVLTELEARRDAGASREELIEALPADLLLRVGYFGKPSGAAEALRRLAVGLDVAIVRVVTARPGVAAVMAAVEACSPHRGVGA